MARNVPAVYNGSAAYDLYRNTDHFYHGTAAPEIQHPGLPEERALPQHQRRVKAKAVIAPFAIVGMAVAICMLILMIFGYVQLYEATERVSNLSWELSNLQDRKSVV